MLRLEDFELEDRARGMVSVTSKWDEILDVLTGADRWMKDENAEAALVAMIRPLAHPLLDPDALRDLALDLRNAVNARAAYECYGYLPDHLDEKLPDTYSGEEAEQALDDDVDAALFPLLTGSTTPCWECKRIKCDVTFWQPATHAMRCQDHQLVLAGRS